MSQVTFTEWDVSSVSEDQRVLWDHIMGPLAGEERAYTVDLDRLKKTVLYFTEFYESRYLGFLDRWASAIDMLEVDDYQPHAIAIVKDFDSMGFQPLVEKMVANVMGIEHDTRFNMESTRVMLMWPAFVRLLRKAEIPNIEKEIPKVFKIAVSDPATITKISELLIDELKNQEAENLLTEDEFEMAILQLIRHFITLGLYKSPEIAKPMVRHSVRFILNGMNKDGSTIISRKRQ